MSEDGYPKIYDGIRATEVMHKGVKVKSDTQANLTRWLEKQHDQCRCEVRYSGDGGVYTVDIIATPAGMTEHAFVECKPHKSDTYLSDPENRDEVAGWLRKMEIIWESEPGATLILIPWEPWFSEPDLEDRVGPRQFLLNRGQRWRLIDLVSGARVPW